GTGRPRLGPGRRAIGGRIADQVPVLTAADQPQVVGEAAVVQPEVVRVPEVPLDQDVVDEGRRRVAHDLAAVHVLFQDHEDVIERRGVAGRGDGAGSLAGHDRDRGEERTRGAGGAL